MAKVTNITLAGGIKASREPSVVAASTGSAAFEAFTLLSETLAEALAAEELRADPAAWDSAIDDLDADAENAINDAITAARAAGDAPVALASDRRLVFAARFIHCALGIENAPDRVNVLHFFGTNSGLWTAEASGLTARRVDALMSITVKRLLALMNLMVDAPDARTAAFG